MGPEWLVFFPSGNLLRATNAQPTSNEDIPWENHPEILKNQLQVVCELGWKLAVEMNGHMERLMYKQSS
jgi:hypothetical protein